jgi:hypothetical protein
MRSRGVAKISISLPKDLARSLKRRVGARGVSSFAARAIRHELEREQLGDYLAELDAELGPVPEELLREARGAWPKR